MSKRFKASREIRIPMDQPSAWSLAIAHEADGSITLGLIFGNKVTYTHDTTLTREDFRYVLEQVGLTDV